MHKNPFQHVDLRVSDLALARPFYERLLPALGFTRDDTATRWQVFSAPGELPAAPWFAFIEDERHTPNANRIAFWAADRAEVDRIGKLLEELDAGNVSGPRACPEYGPSYYAVFFDDPCGNPLEVCYVAD